MKILFDLLEKQKEFERNVSFHENVSIEDPVLALTESVQFNKYKKKHKKEIEQIIAIYPNKIETYKNLKLFNNHIVKVMTKEKSLEQLQEEIGTLMETLKSSIIEDDLN